MPSQIKGSEHNFLLRKSRVFVSFLKQIGLVIHLFLFAGRVISVIGGPTVYRRFLPEPIPGDSTGAGPKKSRARRKRGRKSTNFFMPNSSARPLVPCTVIIMSSPSVSLLPPPPFIFQINKMTSPWPKALVIFHLLPRILIADHLRSVGCSFLHQSLRNVHLTLCFAFYPFRTLAENLTKTHVFPKMEIAVKMSTNRCLKSCDTRK